MTVGLVFSVCTISRMPFAEFTSEACTSGSGTRSDFTAASAQSGRATGLVGVAVVFSRAAETF